MRLHRFFLDKKIADLKKIDVTSAELVNQLKKVFRFKVGDRVIVFDNSGFEYEASVSDFDKDSVVFDILNEISRDDLNNRKTHLFVSIVKKDTFEWITEKATELGVSDIYPVLADRSEKKNLNEYRLRKISIEASEQSGRTMIPNIHSILSFDEAISFTKENSIPSIAFHMDGNAIHENKYKNDIAVFIGPEGGWSERELKIFEMQNIPIYNLGKLVLRAETAVIVALAKLF